MDVPLTDLCAICHVNRIKYTCPRDGIHTCSLTCVRRHKQWAQCSGVRDPAEYRKRSELATAASIDKDFNFITKVERSLSRADDVVANRGIDLVPARLKSHDQRPKFELEAEARNIKIIKAPKGLSRSKQNKSQWSKQSNCIFWTVEWLCQDGRKLMGGASEDKPVKDLFDALVGPKRNSKKRKRPVDAAEVPMKSTLAGKIPTPIVQDMTDKSPSLENVSSESQPGMKSVVDEEPQSAVQEDLNDELHDRPSLNTANMSTEPPELHFYLHRPNTESRYRCLIPISSTDSLDKALNSRTLIEFPTIYVRTEPPDQLQQPFISEAEYLSRYGNEIPINLTVPTEPAADAEDDLEEGEVEEDDMPAGLNQMKVLEVLAKDLDG